MAKRPKRTYTQKEEDLHFTQDSKTDFGPEEKSCQEKKLNIGRRISRCATGEKKTAPHPATQGEKTEGEKNTMPELPTPARPPCWEKKPEGTKLTARAAKEKFGRVKTTRNKTWHG